MSLCSGQSANLALSLFFFLVAYRLIFYFPILGAINLFTHILRAPQQPSALSDVALIEVVAGSFAQLEYASGGQLDLDFPRKMAEYARRLVSQTVETQTDLAETRLRGTDLLGQPLPDNGNNSSAYDVLFDEVGGVFPVSTLNQFACLLLNFRSIVYEPRHWRFRIL